jgi:hypothetical protein
MVAGIMIFDLDPKKNLEENYNRIGPLSREQFFAVKSLSRKVVYVRGISEIKKIDWLGNETAAKFEEIEEGDSVKIVAKARNMAGGQERLVSVTLNDVTEIVLDKPAKTMILANEEYYLVNIDCQKDIEALRLLINSPEIWVSVEELANLLPANMTLADFEDVKDRKEKELELEKEREGTALTHETDSLDFLF